MNFRKKSKLCLFVTTVLTIALCFGATVSGTALSSLSSLTHGQNTDVSTIQLEMNELKSIIVIPTSVGFVSYPQTAYFEVSEDNTKIQINAHVFGTSARTLELISPKGVIERSYMFNESGFLQGDQEYIDASEKIMVSDIAERGTWTLKLSSNEFYMEKISISAMLIEADVFVFNTGKVIAAPQAQDSTANAEILDQTYDYYKTYEEARSDIEKGYVFSMDKSFSIAAMPCVNSNQAVSFYVHHNNTLDIVIGLKNLIDGTGRDPWTPDSFVQFEIRDPTGKIAYSFYKQGKEIESLTEISTEITLFPGKWKYNINFAYTTDGNKASNFVVSAKYRNLYSDDIQWLLDNKLNILY